MATRRNRWAYAAAIWAFAFAAVSFYWAVGGTVGLDTLSRDLEADAREGGAKALSLTLVPGIAKALAGLLALGLAGRVKLPFSPRITVRLAWLVAAGLTLYGAILTAEKVLMKLDAVDTPAALGGDRLEWYLFFWDPLWLAGGLLFGLAAHTREDGREAPRRD